MFFFLCLTVLYLFSYLFHFRFRRTCFVVNYLCFLPFLFNFHSTDRPFSGCMHADCTKSSGCVNDIQTEFIEKARADFHKAQDPFRAQWQHPQRPSAIGKLPDLNRWLLKSVFLWDPERVFSCKLKCPCGGELGPRVRWAAPRYSYGTDRGQYLQACHYECRGACKKTIVSSDIAVLLQLDAIQIEEFPFVCTQKACLSKALIRDSHIRLSDGDQVARMRLSWNHTRLHEYMRRQTLYYQQCDAWRTCACPSRLVHMYLFFLPSLTLF